MRTKIQSFAVLSRKPGAQTMLARLGLRWVVALDGCLECFCNLVPSKMDIQKETLSVISVVMWRVLHDLTRLSNVIRSR